MFLSFAFHLCLKMLQIILPILTVLLFIRLLKIYSNWRYKANLINQLPGPSCYPIIGNAFTVFKRPRNKRLTFSKELNIKYGNILRIWLTIKPVILIYNAEHAEVILTSRTNIQKSFFYSFFEPWLGTGLLVSNGSKWHYRRKILTPAFHFSVLDSFLPVIVDHSQIFIDRLKEKVDGPEFNIYSFISECTLDMIAETSMGVKLNIQKNQRPEYLRGVLEMNEVIAHRVLRPWIWNNYVYQFTETSKREKEILKILHGMSKSVIQKRRKERITANTKEDTDLDELGLKNRKAFLDVMLDISEQSEIQMTEEDIREEVDTFMFEGHDTTASAISTLIFAIASHPAVQEKVAEELYSVFGDSDRSPTHKDLTKLKYLECTIKEALRLYPPVPLIARQLQEDITLGGKHLIPAGTVVELNIHRIHRQESSFPDPESFNPDNFLPENSSKRHPFAFIPFSAGPRNCIGQKFAMLEEKVIISSLLRNYQFNTNKSEEEINLIPESVLRPENGIHVMLKPRDWTKFK